MLTDADHKSGKYLHLVVYFFSHRDGSIDVNFIFTGFKGQSMVLSRMWALVETNEIAGPLFNPAEHEANMDNSMFLKEYTLGLLSGAFPHVQPLSPNYIPLLHHTKSD